MAKSKSVTLTESVAQKVGQWFEAKKQLDVIKANELALRNELVMQAGFDPSKLEGTETLAIENWPGWKIKAKKDQYFNLTNKNGETVALLTGINEIAGRTELAQNLVRWEPSLAEKLYKDEFLPLLQQFPQLAELAQKALTIKPGQPQLELIPPEEKKEETK